MSENPYAIPVEELVGRTRVPVTDQVEVQIDPAGPHGLSHGDAAGDADGD